MNRTPIVVASGNSGKLVEIRAALSGFDVRSPEEVATELARRGATATIPDPDEIGTSYLANAQIKAAAFARWSGLLALADDSGLEVDALDRRPGLHTARYAGPNCTPQDNIDLMLAEMREIKERGARFVCCLVLCRGDEVIAHVEGECRGSITEKVVGSGGFGYDPIFRPNGESRTFAEMETAEKKRFSHRGHALERMKQELATREWSD